MCATVVKKNKNRCKTDLNSFPSRKLEETTRTSSYYMDETIQQDLKSSDLSMDDTVDLAQNRPLWRLMSTLGAIRTLSGACKK